MLRKATIGFMALTLLVSCNGETSPQKENLLENRTFVHLFFSNEEECLEAQPEPDFFYNCHREVHFYENNEVEIMLTDILWRGKYSIKENLITLSFEKNYEIQDGEIIFKIVERGKLLKLDDDTLWKEVKGNNIWD